MKIELDLKEGKCGDYELKQFTVSAKEAEFHLLRCIINGRTSRALLPGTYWRLMHKGEIIMTNTPRLEIVNADIFAFEPSHKYDYGWYDIWNYICEDNYPEMVSLMKRLSSHVMVQDCWCMQECKSLSM